MGWTNILVKVEKQNSKSLPENLDAIAVAGGQGFPVLSFINFYVHVRVNKRKFERNRYR